LPANSIGYIGGGANTLQGYISLSTGNGYYAGSLGVGTNTLTYTLSVAGTVYSSVSSGANFLADKPTGAAISISGATSTTNYITLQGSNSTNPDLQFYVGGSERVRFTSGGNIGLGTTSPNNKLSVSGNADFGATSYSYAGPSQYGGLVFPRGQILFSNTNSQNQLYLSSNAYTNASGVFAYRNSTQPALALGLDNGAMSFLVAGNGTADVAVSWTTAFTINNNGSSVFGGNVTNSASYKAHTYVQLTTPIVYNVSVTNQTPTSFSTTGLGLPSGCKALQALGWYHITGYGTGAGQGDHAASFFGITADTSPNQWSGAGSPYPGSNSTLQTANYGSFTLWHDGDASNSGNTNGIQYYGFMDSGIITVNSNGNVYCHLAAGYSGGTHYNVLWIQGYWI
jgi:hypothetical protein